MKKLYPALGAVLAALLLAACQMPGALGVGSLKIAVPAPSALRGATTSGHGDQIRIQLVRNGVVVPLGGQATLQQGLAGQTITVDGLATGTNYKIYASSGSTATNGSGFFETSYYAESDLFEISAGTSTDVSVTLNPTSISIIEDVASSNHAAVTYNGTLYFINGSAVYTGTSGLDPAVATNQTSAITSYLGTSGATTVYSISDVSAAVGSQTLWFNTDKGILPSNGTAALVAPAMWASGGGNLNPVPTVWASGAIHLTGGAGGYMAVYYGPGLNVGLAPSSAANFSTGDFNSGNPKWTTLTAALNLSQGSTLQTALNKLNQAVSGLATDSANYLYLSTGIGAYRLDSTLLGQSATALGTDLTNGNDGNGNSILLATEDGALIGPVSTYSDTTSKAFAFAGTNKGLYASPVATATGIPSTGDAKLALLPETAGMNITSLSTRSYTTLIGYTNTAYTAAYSASTNEILVYKDLTLWKRFSVLAGVPSGTPQFTWYRYGSGSTFYLLLIIAGSDATVEYLVDSWPNLT